MGFSTTETEEVHSISLVLQLSLENTTQPSVLCSQDTQIYGRWIKQNKIQTCLVRLERYLGFLVGRESWGRADCLHIFEGFSAILWKVDLT